MNKYRKYTFGVLGIIALLLVLGIVKSTEKKQAVPDSEVITSAPDRIKQDVVISAEPLTLIEQQLEVPLAEWRTGVFREPMTLLLPDKFHIQLFATGLQKPRMMAMGPGHILYVSDAEAGTVYALPDTDENGIADEVTPVAEDLGYPTGIIWHNDDLFVADTTRVFRLSNFDTTLALEEKEIIIDDLPRGGIHITRTLAFNGANALFVSVGSSCNACEDNERRGAVLQYTSRGTFEKVYAAGLRNAVGMVWNADKQKLYVTDNGRDFLGDNLPPEEIDILSEGNHYGWPYCYGDRTPDPEFGSEEFCSGTEPPVIGIQAHSAPLGLRFAPDDLGWPSSFNENIFAAFHGSWNRSVPTGYKIVRVWQDSSGSYHTADFISGWLKGSAVLGRPVDVLFDERGAMYITDDKNGVIYRVTYELG